MSIPARFAPLAGGASRKKTNAAIIEFLTEIWDYNSRAYTFLSVKKGKFWKDNPIRGDRAKAIEAVLTAYPSDRFHIYFCPNSFSAENRIGQNARRTRYAWCDIDEADPNGYDPQPNILWESSPGRHQGLWIWDKKFRGEVAEAYSRNIVYKDGGDNGGWSVTKLLRVPGTINNKPKYNKPIVTLRSFDATRQPLPNFLSDIDPGRLAALSRVQSIPFESIDPFKHDPKEIIAKYRRRMDPFPRAMLTADRVLYPDKSDALYAMISNLVRLDASNDEIAAALRDNPHFTERENMSLDDLCADILRIRAKREAGL